MNSKTSVQRVLNVARSREVYMKLVVEALLVIYLFYLGSELILTHIRKPLPVGKLSRAIQLSFSGWSIPAGVVQACESRPKRGLYITLNLLGLPISQVRARILAMACRSPIAVQRRKKP